MKGAFSGHDTTRSPGLGETTSAPARRTGPERPAAGLFSSGAGHVLEEPVFVDPSGRRRSRARRFGWLLVVPAAAYLVLLVTALLGEPALPRASLPLPETKTPAPSSPATTANDDNQNAGARSTPTFADAPTTIPRSFPVEAPPTRRPASAVAAPASVPAVTAAPAPSATAPPVSPSGQHPAVTPRGFDQRTTPAKKP